MPRINGVEFAAGCCAFFTKPSNVAELIIAFLKKRKGFFLRERITDNPSRTPTDPSHSPMRNHHDPKLRQALRTWQVIPPPAPNFKSNVWRRIAVAEERAARPFATKLRDWFLLELPKPGYATVLLVLTALVGTTAAGIRAEQMRERHRVELARQYLASINPLAMAHQMSDTSR